MKSFPSNPRQITKKRASRLQDTLARLGDLSGIVHNLETDEIAGGHQRLRVMFGEQAGEFRVSDADIEIVMQLDAPDSQGTVAHGFLIWRGGRYAYRQVRWDAETMREANIAANLGAVWRLRRSTSR